MKKILVLIPCAGHGSEPGGLRPATNNDTPDDGKKTNTIKVGL